MSKTFKMPESYREFAKLEADQQCIDGGYPLNGKKWKEIFKSVCEEALNHSLTPKILDENNKEIKMSKMDFAKAMNPAIKHLKNKGDELFTLSKRGGLIDSKGFTEQEKMTFLNNSSYVSDTLTRMLFPSDYEKYQNLLSSGEYKIKGEKGNFARLFIARYKLVEIYVGASFIVSIENLLSGKNKEFMSELQKRIREFDYSAEGISDLTKFINNTTRVESRMEKAKEMYDAISKSGQTSLF